MNGSTQAWLIYCAGLLGLMLVWWRIIRPLPNRAVGVQLLVLVLALLACPYSIEEGSTRMAPALLMVLMNTLFEEADSLERVGPTLLGVVIAAMLITAVLQVLWYRHRSQQRQQQERDAHYRALLRESQAGQPFSPTTEGESR